MSQNTYKSCVALDNILVRTVTLQKSVRKDAWMAPTNHNVDIVIAQKSPQKYDTILLGYKLTQH